MQIRKAVITAAGVGTRFLPVTKAIQKELIPVINKPTVQYVVENCVAAGIKEIVIVTRSEDNSIESYFSPDLKLEQLLDSKNKRYLISELEDLYKLAKITFVKQDDRLPYGNASPLYSARKLIGNEPFIYAWGDDLLIGEGAGAPEMVDIFSKMQPDIILNCIKVPQDKLAFLGVVKFKNSEQGTGALVDEVIEKPSYNNFPSSIASVSPYIFTPKLFEYLDPRKIDQGKEFIIQTAINHIAKHGKVVANITKGKWLTTGDPFNYLVATLEVGLQSKEYGKKLISYFQERRTLI